MFGFHWTENPRKRAHFPIRQAVIEKNSIQDTVEQSGVGGRGKRSKIIKCNPYRSILCFLLDLRSILITCRFHICEYGYVWKFISNSQISVHVSFAVIHGTCRRRARDFTSLTCASPAGLKQRSTLPSRPSCPTVNRGPFCSLFSALFFTSVLLCV